MVSAGLAANGKFPVNQALCTRLRVKSIAAILCHFFIPNAIMRK